jgi:hypothetical protein
MDAGNDSDASLGASQSSTAAAFREEADRVVLANALFSLALGSADGTILSIRHLPREMEMIDAAEAAANGFLWQLEIHGPSGGVTSVTNRDAAAFTYQVARHRHEGAIRLWLEWSGFRIGASEVDAHVTASVSVAADKPVAEFEAEIGVPDHLSVRSFTFPCLCAVGSLDLGADESLFLPTSGGLLVRRPLSPSTLPDERSPWRAEYPGPAALQLFGYVCGARTTLWLASRDSSGARKAFVASDMPGSPRVMLSITHYPALQPDGHLSAGYPSVIGVVPGDWYEAAREYRAWAVKQPWCARGKGGERGRPALTGSQGLWASYWGGARGLASAVHELQRLINLPVKLDWRCWHQCARDGAYPDYFPTRDGDDVFAATARRGGSARPAQPERAPRQRRVADMGRG